MLLAFADLDFVLSGDEDFQDMVGQIHGLGSLSQGGSDFVFMARIGVNYIPFGFFRSRFADDDVVSRVFFSLFFDGVHGFNLRFDISLFDWGFRGLVSFFLFCHVI